MYQDKTVIIGSHTIVVTRHAQERFAARVAKVSAEFIARAFVNGLGGIEFGTRPDRSVSGATAIITVLYSRGTDAERLFSRFESAGCQYDDEAFARCRAAWRREFLPAR